MRLLATLLAGLLLVSCASDAPVSTTPEPAEATSRPAETAPADDRPVIVAFGDSLSAGHGVNPGLSYPDQLQVELDNAGFDYRVVNAGISGDTTSGGIARVGNIVAMKPAFVILELGGNDGLRGLPIETTYANLDEMIVALKQSGATVVLAGMTLPPNYGPEYISGFEQVYRDLASKHEVALIPFLLEGVAGDTGLMQGDGIHPTAQGNEIVARTVMETLAPLLAE